MCSSDLSRQRCLQILLRHEVRALDILHQSSVLYLHALPEHVFDGVDHRLRTHRVRLRLFTHFPPTPVSKSTIDDSTPRDPTVVSLVSRVSWLYTRWPAL